MEIEPLNPADYKQIIFFTGAGMSAECGVPTYRGSGGIWNKYNWEEVACQAAFDADPEKVLDFHELRRRLLFNCQPHKGHKILVAVEEDHPGITIITQNIDGMHQRAGSINIIELHGSLWRLKCPRDNQMFMDAHQKYRHRKCTCGAWLRPDIVWFSDYLDPAIIHKAQVAIEKADLFISIGTSGSVWPAAGLPRIAADKGTRMIMINPEVEDNLNNQYTIYPGRAAEVIPHLLPQFNKN